MSPPRRPVIAVLAVVVAGTLAFAAAPRAVMAGPGPAPALERGQPKPDAPKPSITWKKIPFGEHRRHQMASYSRRHYGTAAWRLADPAVVVEHVTGGTSFSSAWNTFASNAKHLGEYPGTCAHFIVDTDGTTYQLVPLWIRCRHAMGMNWTAFGIEHVGTSDAAVLGNAQQMSASYALTLWLVQKFHLQVRNVIGHSENLMSPYHVEHVAEFRCQTHADWSHARMRGYRTHLRKLAKRHHVPIGPPPAWVDSDC